jgi:molecular chaperone Hsp33
MDIDHFERGLTVDFAVRYMIVDCTTIAQTAQKRHKLTGFSTRLCTEGILASFLLASQIKGEERLTIQILSQSPKISFLADINAHGELRAKLSPTDLNLDPDKLDGVIVVIKHNKQKELYRGVTDMKDSNIAQALHHNLTQSAQVDTIVQFFISEQEGKIERAVGIILERLPPTEDLPYLNTEEFFTRYEGLSSLEMFEGLQHKKIRGSTLHDLSAKPISWKCRCSRSKVKSMLFSLGSTELTGIRDEIGFAEVTCHFCNEQVLIEKEELQTLIDQHK